MTDFDIDDLKSKAAKATRLLKALSNEYRLLVMCELAQGERSVGALQKVVGLGQSALSQHLARLRRDGLVTARRSAQTVLYTVSSKEVMALMATLYEMYCRDGSEEPGALTKQTVEA
jgi:ArsR family transcriptional regulator, virulence genes transcriptional regulator